MSVFSVFRLVLLSFAHYFVVTIFTKTKVGGGGRRGGGGRGRRGGRRQGAEEEEVGKR